MKKRFLKDLENKLHRIFSSYPYSCTLNIHHMLELNRDQLLDYPKHHILKYINLHGSKLDLTYKAKAYNGNTLLMHIMNYEFVSNEIIMALIATGNSNIGAINHLGKTALMIALECIYFRSPKLILAMIATGEAIPFPTGTRTDNYLLRLACMHGKSDIALALINIQSNSKEDPEFDMRGCNATPIEFARINDMYDVQYVLKRLKAIERRNPAIIAMYLGMGTAHPIHHLETDKK